MSTSLQEAFIKMRETELVLDDVDYLENSSRLQVAIEAAAEFNRVLDREEQTKRAVIIRNPYDLSSRKK